jgi:putative addiction module component (TIGR02574 family)
VLFPSSNGTLASGAILFILRPVSMPDLDNLSAEERVAMMERLWDSLCREEEEPASPPWHEEILAARRDAMDTAAPKTLTLEELRDRYR